ncbi:hypothetical protein [Thermomonospora cellulosilytica]|uniref:Uncharacterized protein n=1 Tax=Thermomonospora cellulosilytica TaxID=1411118 RepID=A0A7W3MWT1_9ACTN|nr:hypothetical protein [Thermomonospora cellulosilytica]MBA9003274.1 hypothetical protein [Thermomonospora cellulosilytica]
MVRARVESTERGPAGQWRAGGELTRTRMRLLGELAMALRELKRGATLVVAPNGDPVLMVRTRLGLRVMGVVVVQDGDGFAYLWDGTCRCAIRDEGSPSVAAVMIAEVER